MDRAGSTAGEFRQIRYEVAAPHVARIVLARPERRNAQGVTMTYELDAAFRRAAHDPEIKVIILAGDGPDFCAGHDLKGDEGETAFEALSLWGPQTGAGWEGGFARERELYLDITERWRALPKPTIAQVHGRCIAGGNMLAFACDLIVASSDARFRDNTIDMGVCGAELFNHPFELGVRKAKEWLFTADWIEAEEARQRGMVNHVTAPEALEDFTLALARRIASKPMFALRMVKEACNSAQDAMGRVESQRIAFALHQLCHTDNLLKYGLAINPESLPPAIQDAVRRRSNSQRQDSTRPAGTAEIREDTAP